MVEHKIPIRELEQLLLLFREAQHRADEHAKATHKRFNVFTTLLKFDDEVRLHSRFLRCLLNPLGSHGCDALFAKLFFDTLKECPALDHEGKKVSIDFPSIDESWLAENKEHHVPEVGNIDIFLWKRKDYGIAIENKPNPDKHEDQLKRYAVWLSAEFKDRWLLFYLTRAGGECQTADGMSYLRISYTDHILKWLEKCLRETYDKNPINQALLQYRAVVLELVGQNLNPYMSNIVEYVGNNPDIIHYRPQLDEAIKQAITRFWERVAEGIQKELNEFQVRPHEQQKFGINPNGALIIKTSKVPFEIYIENDIDPNDDILCVGICVQETTSEDNKELFARMHEKLKNSKGDCWDDAGRSNSNWPSGWAVLIAGVSGDSMVELMKNKPEQTVSRVCTGVRDYISRLGQVYTEVKRQESKL